MTSTGIPIEVLFGALGALIVAIYGGIVSEIRTLKKSGLRRDLLLVKICDKLAIPFPFDGD